MTNKELEYHRSWRNRNRDKVRRNQKRFRSRHLELCRKRVRENQIILNDKKRFGGFRIKALERDNYTCQECGKDVSGKRMAHIHHINHDRQDNRLNNFKTLCHSCHAKHHNIFKKRDKNMRFI